MKNPTSLVTAIRDRVNGQVTHIVDEDGKMIAVSEHTPVALTDNATLTDGDNNGLVYNNTATARTLTVPAGLKAGFKLSVAQNGTGAISFAAGAGVTIQSSPAMTKTGGAGSLLWLTQTAPNTYILTGNGAA